MVSRGMRLMLFGMTIIALLAGLSWTLSALRRGKRREV